MIEAPEAPAVRALLAVFSDEASSPNNITAMKALLTSLGLDGELAAERPLPTGRPELARVRALNHALLRDELLATARRKERVEAGARVLAVMYERVRKTMLSIADQASQNGVDVRRPALCNELPIEIYLLALQSNADPSTIFECAAVRNERQLFSISLICEYRVLLEGAWPFLFRLELSRDFGYHGTNVIHLPSGQALSNFGRAAANEAFFPDLLQKWLEEPAHWDDRIV